MSVESGTIKETFDVTSSSIRPRSHQQNCEGWRKVLGSNTRNSNLLCNIMDPILKNYSLFSFENKLPIGDIRNSNDCIYINQCIVIDCKY